MADTGGHIVFRDDAIELAKDETVLHRKTYDNLFSVSDASTSFPEGCRASVSNEVTTVFVIEQDPCVREVSWAPTEDEWKSVVNRGCLKKFGLTKDDQDQKVFQLAFPYTVFVVRVAGNSIVNLAVYFRTETVLSLSDYLLQAGLVLDNVMSGKDMVIEKTHGMNEAYVAERAVEAFWKQTFVSTDAIRDNKKVVSQVQSPWDWEYFSVDDAVWVLSSKWASANTTVGAVIKNGFDLDVVEAKSTHENLFYLLRQRLIKDDCKKKAAGNDFEESPVTSVCLNGNIVRQGDVLLASGSELREVKVGKEYLLLGFFKHRKLNRVTHALLDGVDIPVVLNNNRTFFYKVLSQSTNRVVDEFVCEEGKICVGTLIEITDHVDLGYWKTGVMFKVTGLRFDAYGDLQVQTDKTAGLWVYITSNKGKMFSSVRIVIPRLIENVFTFEAFTLSVGDVVSFKNHGSTFAVSVAQIRKISDVLFKVKFDGFTKEFSLFENSQVALVLSPLEIAFSDLKLKFDGNVFDANTKGKYLLSTFDSNVLPRGFVYEVSSIERRAPHDGHSNDFDLILCHCNEPIPIVRDSAWVFPAGLEQVSVVRRIGRIQLSKGDCLVLASGSVSGLKNDESYEILCFSTDSTDNSMAEIVFTNGISVGFNKALLSCFKRVGKKDTRVFTEDQLYSLPQGPRSSNDLRRGDRVMYLGGDPDVARGFDNNESLNTPGVIVESDYGRKHVKFDKILPVGSRDGKRYQWIYSRYLRNHRSHETVKKFNKVFGTGAVFTDASRKEYELPGVLMDEYAFFDRSIGIRRHYGESAGDANNRRVAVGDVVVVVRSTYDSFNISRRHMGVPGVIIDFKASYSGAMLYVLIHERVQNPLDLGMTNDTVSGITGLPSRYRTQEWIGKILLVDAVDTKVLSIEFEKTPVEKDSIPAQAGDTVKVKEDALPRFLWGAVEKTATGILKQIVNGNIAIVNLPDCKLWRCDISDLEVVSKKPQRNMEDLLEKLLD